MNSWDKRVNYYVKHFIDHRGSSYFNAVFQCLAHIPALTRLILETNTLNIILTTEVENQLSKYVAQLFRYHYKDPRFDPELNLQLENIHLFTIPNSMVLCQMIKVWLLILHEIF